MTCVKAHVKGRERREEERDLCLKIADGGGDGGGAKDTSSLVRMGRSGGGGVAWVNERVKRDTSFAEGIPDSRKMTVCLLLLSRVY